MRFTKFLCLALLLGMLAACGSGQDCYSHWEQYSDGSWVYVEDCYPRVYKFENDLGVAIEWNSDIEGAQGIGLYDFAKLNPGFEKVD